MLTQPELRRASFSQRRPILAVIIIELLLLIAIIAAGAYATIKELDYTAPVLLAFLPIAFVLIVYLTWKKKWSQYGFRSIRSIPGTSWTYYLPLAVILLLLALQGFQSLSISQLAFFLFFTLLVGFVEETIYRGFILTILLKKSVPAAVLVSSLLFGLTHAANALSGKSAGDTVLQIVYALLIGISLALLMVKNGNIFPLILFHFLHNLIQFTTQEVTSTLYNLIILFILLIHCIWLVVVLKNSRNTE